MDEKGCSIFKDVVEKDDTLLMADLMDFFVYGPSASSESQRAMFYALFQPLDATTTLLRISSKAITQHLIRAESSC